MFEAWAIWLMLFPMHRIAAMAHFGEYKTPVVYRWLIFLQVFEITLHKPHKLSHAKELLLHLQYSLLIQKNEQALAPASQHVDHSAQFLMINQRCFFAYWITP